MRNGHNAPVPAAGHRLPARHREGSDPAEAPPLANVDLESAVWVDVQTENHVQFAIAAGRLTAGDPLPSVRELSERLKVNPNTVAKAYRDLEVMGLVYTRRCMGVSINPGAESKGRKKCRTRLVSRLHEIAAEAKAARMNGIEVGEVVRKSYASASSPYGEVLAAVLALEKKR